MNRLSRSRLPFSALLWAVVFLCVGCVHPLGPGFRFTDRGAQIRQVSGTPPEIRIRIVDQMENTGDRPLRSLKANLPPAAIMPAKTLSVTVDGQKNSPEIAGENGSRSLQLTVHPVWKRNQSREIVTEWRVSPETSSSRYIGSQARAFYIADVTALPLWQAPQGIFTRGGPDARKQSLTIFAPPDFRVLGPGQPARTRRVGDQIAYLFHNKKRRLFIPFVIAGNYQQQRVRVAQGSVDFWTFHPIDPGQAETAAVQLAASMSAFEGYFGPLSKGEGAIHIVEVPGELPSLFGRPDGPGATSFPGGVLLDSRGWTQGVATELVLELAEVELAQTWFGWQVRPRPGAELLMGRGADLFGLVVAAESRSEAQRKQMVSSLLKRYDEARQAAPDQPLIGPPGGYPRAQQISTEYKAALFFVALEDSCGRDNFQKALTHIVQGLGGGQAGMAVLRAAAEEASGRDLAGMFRTWVAHSGIPVDFRARYADGSSTAGASF